LPLQHPFGHELLLHWHRPGETHASPVGHAAQLAPPVPQEPADSDANVSHVPVVPPLQQPLGHVVASHAHAPVVVSHRPCEQEAQIAPPAPHCVGDSEA